MLNDMAIELTGEDLDVLRKAKAEWDGELQRPEVAFEGLREHVGYLTQQDLYPEQYLVFDFDRLVGYGFLERDELSINDMGGTRYRITDSGRDILKASDHAEEARLVGEKTYDVIGPDWTPEPDMNDDSLYLEGIAVGHVESDREVRELVKAHFAEYSPRAEYDDVEAINPPLVFAEVTVLIDATRTERDNAKRLAEDANRIMQRYAAGFSQLVTLFDCLSDLANERDEYGNPDSVDLRGAVKLAYMVSDKLNRDLVDGVREPDERVVYSSTPYDPDIDIPF